MNKLTQFAGISLLALTLAGPAFALNPQPEPPGKNIIMHQPSGTTLHTIGSATSGAGAGKASDADDNYCGTPVPGHPHVNAMDNQSGLPTGVRANGGAHSIIIEGSTAAHCNARTIGSATGGAGSGKAHANSIGSATAGAGSGR